MDQPRHGGKGGRTFALCHHVVVFIIVLCAYHILHVEERCLGVVVGFDLSTDFEAERAVGQFIKAEERAWGGGRSGKGRGGREEGGGST